MQLQPTVGQAPRQCALEAFGLSSDSAVAEHIVGLAFKEDACLVACHPYVECIMQKEVTQHGAGHAPNNVAKRRVEFFVRLSREQLRPTYGQGFRGAPLQPDTEEPHPQMIRPGGARAKATQPPSEASRSEEEV